MGGRGVPARGARGGGQGAGAADDRRPRATAPGTGARTRRRRAGHRLGGARVPGARRVVVRAGGRSGDPVGERWGVRREGGVAGTGRRPGPRRPHRSHGARRVRPRGRRAPRAQASTDRRGRGATPTAASRCAGWSSATSRRSSRRWRGRTGSTRSGSGRARPHPDRRPRRRCARSDSRNARSCSRARSTRPRSIGTSLVVDDRAASVLLDSCVAVASGATAGARVRCSATGVIEGSTCASSPVIRSIRSGAAFVRDRCGPHGSRVGAHRRPRGRSGQR